MSRAGGLVYSTGLNSAAPPRVLGVTLFLFSLGAFLTVLEAYSLFSIPLTWFSAIIYIVAAIVPLLSTGRLTVPRGTSLLFLYLFWSLLALSLYLATNEPPAMPARTTTPYPVYLILRFLFVIVFIAVVTTSYWMVRRGALEQVIRVHAGLLAFVSISALYIYAAQIAGFWEPPRNRMGTGGQDFLSEGVHFTYAFHRALGTFREPSHLAEWLAAMVVFLLPVMASYIRTLYWWLIVFLALVAITLTGSLLGAICLASGLLTLLILQKGLRLLASIAGLFLLMLAIVLVVNSALEIDVLGTLAPRFVEMIAGGVGATNRAYVYDYLEQVPLTFMGYGLGTGPLLFASALGSDFIVPFLNLFISVAHDAGLVGVVCIVIYFSLPFIFAFRYGISSNPLVAGCLASHVSWIFAYLGRSPELSPAHAVPVGILMACFFLSSRRGLPSGHNRLSVLG
jgi:hypothetical protein